MIRLADIRDTDALVDLCEHFYQSAPHRQYASLDLDKTRSEVIRYLTGDKTRQIVFVAEDNGLHGILSAMTVPVFFSNELRAYESLWYVTDPKYSRDALRLFDAYEYWAKRVGCTSISISTMVNDRLEKFYVKNGYAKLETSFVKRI